MSMIVDAIGCVHFAGGVIFFMGVIDKACLYLLHWNGEKVADGLFGNLELGHPILGWSYMRPIYFDYRIT